MKRLSFFSVCLILHLNVVFGQSPSVNNAQAQEIKRRSELWNSAYNNRDSLTFYTLFDSLAVLTSAGARRVGLEQCKTICRLQYVSRPDIRWINKATSIEINGQWHVAYEIGNWTEDWTESGDTSRSQIKGKYCIMWRFTNSNWVIISGIFTPLSCTGSYCTKQK